MTITALQMQWFYASGFYPDHKSQVIITELI